MRYRQATDADGDAVAAVIGSVFSEYDGCVFDRRAEFGDLDAVASAFTTRGGAFWVAEETDGTVSGCIGIAPLDDCGTFELHRLYLLPHVRGTGAGARLLALAIRHAREQGARRIELWTDCRFLAGQRFYERHGFVRLPGTRQLDDLSRSEEYHYVLTLTQATPAGSALSASRACRSPSGGGGIAASPPSSHGRHRMTAPWR